MTPHISDLIVFKRAEKSGHILCDYKAGTTTCPPRLDCGTCPFTSQCDDQRYLVEDDSFVTGWLHAFQKMPEFSLTHEELQKIYPEYFI